MAEYYICLITQHVALDEAHEKSRMVGEILEGVYLYFFLNS